MRFIVPIRPWYAAGVALCMCMLSATTASAQIFSGGGNSGFGGGGFGGGGRGVGGVSIDANGVLSLMTVADKNELKQVRQAAFANVPAAIGKAAKLRFVSLAGLEAALKQVPAGQAIPPQLQLLAGLQRIEFVLVDPISRDIVLAGPGEGWKVADDGSLIGATNHLPFLHLDDLVTALRSTQTAKHTSITCSIDATPEGIARYREVSSRQKAGADPQSAAHALEEALGPHVVSVTGVPATSRFASVLVAADYRMKRLGMKFDASPIAGMPSYLDLISAGPAGPASALPRWWLAPNYGAIARDAEGLTFKLSGSVKCLAEEDFFADNGQKTATAKASPAAAKWAESMTKNYDALAAKEPVFAELHNCMDLALVAALISKENLLQKADLKLEILLDQKALVTEQLVAPKTIASQASLVKKGSNWVISVSGGVKVESWETASRVKEDRQVSDVRKQAPVKPSGQWWWN